ncbi:hypothetical protein, partial [Vibrio metschnikovii]|uniref:hypothetical protein n=1 Tax=Vibrio metschnikovii TaxID=28172 RepID=UPI002FC87F19
TEVHGFAIRCMATLPTRLRNSNRLLLYRVALEYGMHSTDSMRSVNRIFLLFESFDYFAFKNDFFVYFFSKKSLFIQNITSKNPFLLGF